MIALLAATLSTASPVHILSDTPSLLRKQATVQTFFAADVDRPSSNATAAACSGRGASAGAGRPCTCWPGYSGRACEFAGPAWVPAQQPGLVPASRSLHSLTPVGRRLYLFGGMTYLGGKAHRLNDLHYYNVDTHRWTTPFASGHWPTHRSGHTTTLVRAGSDNAEKLYVFGGIDGTDAYCADLDVYTVARQTWARVAANGPAPSARSRHAAAALGAGSLWIFGGARYDGPTVERFNDVHILDTSASPPSWRVAHVSGVLPPARSGHSATLSEDGTSVIVFGGDGGTASADPTEGYLSDVWIFRTGGGWSRLATTGNPPAPRTLHTATRVGGWLAIVGGDVSGAKGMAMHVHVLQLETGKWRQLSSHGLEVTHRMGHQLVAVGTSALFLLGGTTGGATGEVADGMHELSAHQQRP